MCWMNRVFPQPVGPLSMTGIRLFAAVVNRPDFAANVRVIGFLLECDTARLSNSRPCCVMRFGFSAAA